MNTLAAYSGKIEVRKDGCYVQGQKLPECPKTDQSLVNQPFMQSGVVEPGSSNLDVLPPNSVFDVRNDLVFVPLFFAVVLTLAGVAIFKIKAFGMTLEEYLKPIWYFVVVAIATVFWQYLVGVNLERSSLELRISQWVWEAMVLASAYTLSKTPKASYGNMVFLGVLYSLLIHGLKVSIRYFFYAKTLWYVLDRFLYGSLLVMAIAGVLGSVMVYARKKGYRF